MKLKPWIKIASLLAVVLLSLALRLRAVDSLPIDFDEDDYLRAGQIYAAALREGDWQAIQTTDYNLEHPPLVKLTYGLVLAGLPAAPEVSVPPLSAPPAQRLPEAQFLAARLTSALFGTLQVLLLALLNPLAGLFLGIHTFTIKYTSQVYLEALPAFTSLAAALAYLRSRRAAGRSRLAWLALSATALGLTAAGKYIYAVVGVAIALHWLGKIIQARSSGSGLRPFAVLFGWGMLSLAVFYLADPSLWPDPLSRLQASLLFNYNYATEDQLAQLGYIPWWWQPLTWLLGPVPWHPGVFLVSLDTFITLLSLLGVRALARREDFWGVWLGTGLVFLFLWPTKWPQYSLILTAPLALAAAAGLQSGVIDPARARWQRRRAAGRQPGRFSWQDAGRQLRTAAPWLAPGLLALGLVTLFPLLFQGAMALTDFSAPAIRDGLSGGVWREVRLGLTGQVEPVEVDFSARGTARQVRYAGFDLLFSLFSLDTAPLLVFEVIWTALSVLTQTALGLGVALLLYQRGVRFKGWWRALYILPWAIPEFVGALLWMQILEPSFGWLNLAAQTWYETADYPGAPTFVSAWQEDPNLALIVLLVAGMWYGLPFMLLAASAGLKAIPEEVFEAAALDGAGGWSLFRQVTWPLLAPLLLPAVIIRAIFAFNQFYLFAVLQPPFPTITLSTISYNVFDTNRGGGLFALSAAINIYAVVILLLLILAFNRWSRAAEGVTYA